MAGVAALALGLPGPALGQELDCAGPTGDQYCPPTEVLTGSGSGTGDPPGDSGSLPFTGLDLGLTLAAAAGLLGAGAAVRRASRASE